MVVLFAYPMKLNISTRKGVTKKFYKRSCIVILTHLSNATNKVLDKISFHIHPQVLDRNCNRVQYSIPNEAVSTATKDVVCCNTK